MTTSSYKPSITSHIPIIFLDEDDEISYVTGPVKNNPKDYPKNNDGRAICAWCGEKTKKVDGIFKFYDICQKCKR